MYVDLDFNYAELGRHHNADTIKYIVGVYLSVIEKYLYFDDDTNFNIYVMKKLFMIVAIMIAGAGYSQKLPKNLTRSEKKYVKSVIELTNDILVDVTKRNDGIIVVEFWNTMYTLNEFGYIDEVWVLEDEDWMALGNQE
jgi:repressor of nif and glnA expression